MMLKPRAAIPAIVVASCGVLLLLPAGCNRHVGSAADSTGRLDAPSQRMVSAAIEVDDAGKELRLVIQNHSSEPVYIAWESLRQGYSLPLVYSGVGPEFMLFYGLVRTPSDVTDERGPKVVFFKSLGPR